MSAVSACRRYITIWTRWMVAAVVCRSWRRARISVRSAWVSWVSGEGFWALAGMVRRSRRIARCMASSFSHYEDREGIGEHRRASTAAAPGFGVGAGRRRRTVLGGDEEHVAGLGVERGSFGAAHGLHGLLDLESGWALFLDDGQRAVAVGAEGLHRRGVEERTVGALADGLGVDDRAGVGIHDHEDVRLAAGHEEDLVFGVEGQAGGRAAFAAELVVRGDLEFFRVDGGDVVLVFDIDVDVALAVGDGLFGRAAEIEGAGDRAVAGVEDGGVRHAVAEDP